MKRAVELLGLQLGLSLLSAPTLGSSIHPFCLVPLDKVDRQACWAHVCRVMTARGGRAGLQGLPALRLWELVLGIFPDKRFRRGGKRSPWGSMCLGTWARKKGGA